MQRRLKPFDDEILAFCETLSNKLAQKKDPELLALSFWLRKSHILELKRSFEKRGLLVQRGTVFHIPPSHLDAMLAYSLITSLLIGNSNIVRAHRSNPLVSIIQEIDFPEEMIQFVEYGHEEEITRELSSKADARIIWGGDETIKKIREIPLPPGGIDIPFPDRFSYSVIRASSTIDKPVAAKFFSDVFPFDQSSCSSPKLLFWIGNGEEIFYKTLQEVILEKKFQLPLGLTLKKKNDLYIQALKLPVKKVVEYSNELSVLYLEKAVPECRGHGGLGVIYHVPIKSLDEIADFAAPKDQTLTLHGFSKGEVASLQRRLNGQGITRMVPFGEALHFDPVWDGIDLFKALSKEITIGEF